MRFGVEVKCTFRLNAQIRSIPAATKKGLVNFVYLPEKRDILDKTEKELKKKCSLHYIQRLFFIHFVKLFVFLYLFSKLAYIQTTYFTGNSGHERVNVNEA